MSRSVLFVAVAVFVVGGVVNSEDAAAQDRRPVPLAKPTRLKMQVMHLFQPGERVLARAPTLQADTWLRNQWFDAVVVRRESSGNWLLTFENLYAPNTLSVTVQNIRKQRSNPYPIGTKVLARTKIYTQGLPGIPLPRGWVVVWVPAVVVGYKNAVWTVRSQHLRRHHRVGRGVLSGKGGWQRFQVSQFNIQYP